MSKIIDCITFFDNNFMFDFRYNVMKNYVDKFVVCESLYDHRNNKKGVNFDPEKKYINDSQILHIVVEIHCFIMDRFFIDYGKRINNAILDVIKEILKDLSKSKISSNHCFYITFKTQGSGVIIPDSLKKDYPKEMTIVLQNQFWDLKINKNKFSVVLLFNKKKEYLSIPFNTIVKFYDPFVKFSIQLEIKDEKKQVKKPLQKKKRTSKQKIVSLADFRKKND